MRFIKFKCNVLLKNYVLLLALKHKKMKNLFLLFTFIGIFLSCSKEVKTQVNVEIIGKWIWVETSGGFAGTITTPKSTGNRITIEFTKTSYIKYINGKLDAEMSYIIEPGNSIRKEGKTDLIIYENEKKQSIELKGDKLILFDECFDCFQNEYIRE